MPRSMRAGMKSGPQTRSGWRPARRPSQTTGIPSGSTRPAARAARTAALRSASTIVWAVAKWIASRSSVSGALRTVSRTSTNGAALIRTPRASNDAGSATDRPLCRGHGLVCLQERLKVAAAAIALQVGLPRPGAEGGELGRVLGGPANPLAERVWVVRRDEQSRRPVLHDLAQRSKPTGDHRRGRRVGLEHDQGEALEPD